MSAKQVKSVSKVSDKKSELIASLVSSLKVDDATVIKVAQCEKRLMQAKIDKLSSKCKVIRQQSRNLKFFRHEHTAETIAQVQSLAQLV